MSVSTRILILDDHPMMRLGIAAMISLQPDMEVVAQAPDAETAEAMFAECRPDIAIVDLRLPTESGVAFIRKMHPRFPQCGFLVLTTYEGDEDIFQALQAGASGYLIKGMSQETLIRGIQSVQAGRRFLPSAIRDKLDNRSSREVLSDREREVLGLLAKGMSNKAIACALGVTEATVKSHVSVILSTLGVEDRTQAVLAAIQRGLVHV